MFNHVTPYMENIHLVTCNSTTAFRSNKHSKSKLRKTDEGKTVMENMNPKTNDKVTSCKEDRNKGQRTLVVVDREKLAKGIQDLCWVYKQGKDCPLRVCYEAISACEVVRVSEVVQRSDKRYWIPSYHGKAKLRVEVSPEGYGQVKLGEDWVGCEWIDKECFVNPDRCSVAKVGGCQVYALHGKGKHGKVKSGEHASG